MERLGGALMVLAGVALGGYAFLPSPNGELENSTAVTRIVGAPDGDVRLVASPTVVPASNAQTGVAGSATVRVFSPSAPLVVATPGATGASTTTWTAVVTPERSGNATFKSPKAGDAEARAHLTSDLQRELKRVGCYGGEINGAWTQSTRRAMALFMERVNATLPANEPDYILLTLVQGHAALACGTDCPAGEVYGSDGRCLPAAVVAQANRRAQRYEERLAERREIEHRKAAQQEQLAAEQRVAEARRIAIAQRTEAARLAQNRVIERRNAQRLAAATNATGTVGGMKPAQVATVNSERLPWLDDPNLAGDNRTSADTSAAATATAAATPRAAPLPGMMAIGGPRTAAIAATPPATVGEPSIAGSAGAMRETIARDSTDRDDLTTQRSYVITAPEPRPAVRPMPIREAALIAGLPGTKSGASERPDDFADQQPPAFRKYAPAKIIRRPSADYGAPRIKRKYYGYNGGGKTRRGQPRPGTPRYNVMLSLGGIY